MILRPAKLKLPQGTVEQLTSVLLNPERRGEEREGEGEERRGEERRGEERRGEERRGEERKGGCNRCGQLKGMMPTALAIKGPFYKYCSN